MQNTIVVDPIFRGSRLFYSWMACEAFSRGEAKPVILTRKDFYSDDFPVYFNSDAGVSPIVELPDGFWYGKIEDKKIYELVEAIEARLNHEPSHIHFSGLDEMFPTLLDALVDHFENTPAQVTFSMVQYDARYHLSEGAGFQKMRSRVSAALERLQNLHVLLLDDRLEDDLDPRFAEQIHVIPDPAPLSPEQIKQILADPAASSLYDNSADEIRVVALGRQSDRKGLPDIIRAARELDANAKTRLYVSGSLEAGQEKLRTPLLELVPQPLCWRDEYVSEAEIRRTYRDAHYILLPYDRSFEGSSGVFAYAAAFGKPVIATKHGCIGHRVQRHKVGYVYDSGRHGDLARLLSTLPAPGSSEYKTMQANMSQYEASRNMGAFSRRLNEIVDYAQGRAVSLQKSDVASKRASDRHRATLRTHGRTQRRENGQMFQQDLQQLSAAPSTLDYKQILLFDTSVSSKNIGDHIIMESVKALLRIIFPNCIFVSVPTHEYTGTEALKLLEGSEHAFVCGTNLLASNVNDYMQWKLQGMDAFLLSDLTLLGTGWWQYQGPPNAYSQFMYRRILSNSNLHSVRDGYTKAQLAAAGIANVLNTSCPTTWWLTPRHLQSIPTQQSETVVFTFTDYAKNPDADGAIIKELTTRYREVYCWLQGAGDYAYAESFGDHSLKYIAPTLEAYAEFLDATECDYVGTRLHGGIRALQAGRRALILAVDNRATEIGFDIGLPVIPRNNIQELKAMLDKGWDLDIQIPYQDINTWVKQFGHATNFDLQYLIDKLIYGFPVQPNTVAASSSPVRVSISGEHKTASYMHYRVHFQDLDAGDELAFLMYRTESVFGITIRPGKEGSPSQDVLSGIEFATDGYGEYVQFQFRPNENELTAGSEIKGNDGKLLKLLERYLAPLAENERSRISVRPEISDRTASKAMLYDVAQEFMRRRAS